MDHRKNGGWAVWDEIKDGAAPITKPFKSKTEAENWLDHFIDPYAPIEDTPERQEALRRWREQNSDMDWLDAFQSDGRSDWHRSPKHRGRLPGEA